jgi:hypothetical protein
MGLYGEQILPRILDAACGTKAVEPLRRRVCGGLAGEVVEIGFGSGHNVAFYPAAVTRVAAVEPSDVGWKLAAQPRPCWWPRSVPPGQKVMGHQGAGSHDIAVDSAAREPGVASVTRPALAMAPRPVPPRYAAPSAHTGSTTSTGQA